MRKQSTLTHLFKRLSTKLKESTLANQNSNIIKDPNLGNTKNTENVMNHKF